MNNSKKILITGSGRCGTLSVSIFLDGLKFTSDKIVHALHETKRLEILSLMKKGQWVDANNIILNLKNDIEVSPYISLFPNNPNQNGDIFAIIRDGRNTVKSGMNSGWFLENNNKSTSWTELAPKFNGDRFQQCCQLWVWIYEKLELWNASFLRLEDIINNKSNKRIFFLKKMNIVPNNNIFPITNLALKRKNKIINLGYSELPNWEHWKIEQKKYFIEKCGFLMSKYYPEVDLTLDELFY
jgi:hypothetical protein